MEKRLIIRPVPRSAGEIPQEEGPPIKYEQIDLGVGSRPRFIVVVQGDARRRLVEACQALAVEGNNLGGSPIVWLPPGATMEVYEVD